MSPITNDTRIARRYAVRFALLPVAAGLLAACGQAAPTSGGAGAAPSTGLVAWPARNQWPALFMQAGPRAQAAYRFAVSPDGRETLRWMPCYCGCEADGHTSNLDCYVDEFRSDGSVVLDSMSFG